MINIHSKIDPKTCNSHHERQYEIYKLITDSLVREIMTLDMCREEEKAKEHESAANHSCFWAIFNNHQLCEEDSIEKSNEVIQDFFLEEFCDSLGIEHVTDFDDFFKIKGEGKFFAI